MLIKLSPYAKTVVAAIAAAIAVIANALADGSLGYDDLAAVCGAIASVYAVWRVPNKPVATAEVTNAPN